MAMSFLPQDTNLGKLAVAEVFDFYDGPVLFVCRNVTDQLFLVVLEDEGETDNTWLYVALSLSRFNHIRSGAIDLHTAFSEAESGTMFEVVIPHDGSQSQVRELRIQDISD